MGAQRSPTVAWREDQKWERSQGLIGLTGYGIVRRPSHWVTQEPHWECAEHFPEKSKRTERNGKISNGNNRRTECVSENETGKLRAERICEKENLRNENPNKCMECKKKYRKKKTKHMECRKKIKEGRNQRTER